MSSASVVTYLPATRDNVGHDAPYLHAAAAAVRRNGWRCVVGVAAGRAAAAAIVGDAALPVLYDCQTGGKSNGLGAVLGRLRHAVSIGRFLASQCRDAPGPVTLFIEPPAPDEAFGVVYGLLLARRERPRVWLMVRRPPGRSGGTLRRGLAIAKVQTFWRLVRRLARGRMQLVTDSAGICTALHAMGYESHVLPIPHAGIAIPRPQRVAGVPIRVWWAGYPRPEKGLDIVHHIATTAAPEAEHLVLVVPGTAGIAGVPGGPAVETVDSGMDRTDYEAEMARCDGILLPYDAAAYSQGTSGIFSEAISAGCVPIVTAGTWMADELRCHDLGELVLDRAAWLAPDIAARLAALASASALRPRLDAMRNAYYVSHGIDAFAAALRAVDETAPH